MKKTLTPLLCFWLLLSGMLSLYGAAANPTSLNEKNADLAFAPPAAGFTYVADGGCVPVTVQFYSQLNGPSYSWTFGDGGTSTDCNPIHTYTTPGTYTVTLVATGGTYTTTITVGATPVVTFTGDEVSCLDATETYTATSTIPAASYSWTATGGVVNSSTVGSASITWTSFGINYVNYTITTAAGCTKVFRYKVKVIPPPMVNLPCCDKRQSDEGGVKENDPHNQEGVPGGSEPCGVCAGSYSCYQATIDPTYGIASEYTWNWTVTNGTIVSISPDSTKVCVIWGASGTGTISVTTTHKIYGCQTTRECELEINPGTTPAFSVTGNCISSPVAFDASATTPLANVTSFYWEFGDGYTETTYVPTTSHLYSYTGSYTATLTITTVEGCTYKTTQTFNVISGTRPEIECPGTACEDSRQCYSTTYIAGATYVWTITGDDPGQRTFSANGEEVCVTWGAGPAGTVSVTVIGGGYTCSNTATEVIPIVASTIPINGPDFICQSSFFEEVSTLNYPGACYKWFINGVAQGVNSNELAFNPTLFSDPIKIDVEVDFGLGCCRGSGTKTIKKLPEYNMNFYANAVCIGTTATYTLLFPAGAPSNPVSWSVDGGTIISSTANTVTITWTSAGTGVITAGNNSPTEYCNDGSNNSWNVTVYDKATGDDISGPSVVCPGTSYTYYHGYESPTSSASVSVTPAGATVSANTYSTDITFPSVLVPTTYTISVTYNHSLLSGCGTTKTYDVTVVPATIPTFSGIGGTVCQGDIVTYTCAMPDSQYYDWNVVGGSIISETYAAGILTIQVEWNSTVTSSLSVTNKACGTTNTQAVTVNGKPVVIISQSDVTCGNDSVDLSVADVWNSYNWSTGSSTYNTSVGSAGTYWVVVGNGVCYDSGFVTVSVVTPIPPTLNSFTVTTNPSTYCPKYHQICPNITTGDGTITSYNWSFTGFNISSSTATCPYVALPSSPGLHTGTWTLTITDSYGCIDTLSGSITDSCTQTGGGTTPGGCTPTATFDITGYDPCTGLFSTIGSNVSSVFWDFGDGYTGSGSTPTHFYDSPCDKTVQCVVYDTAGCPFDTTFIVSVPYVITDPDIEVTNASCVGAVSITATGAAICSGGSISYSWTVTPSGGGAPVYTTTTASATLNVGSIISIPDGDYDVSVQITIGGCTKTATGSFSKGGLQAYFVSCGGCSGSPLTFIDQSLPYNDPIIKWEWSFTGPGTYNSFLQNPTITFANSGTYTATLIVTDNDECKDTFTTTIIIQPPFTPGNISVNGNPTASGTVIDICPDDDVLLTAPSGAGYSYIWSTGDNTVTTSVTEPGDYYVTVFNASNCTAKIGPITFRYKPAPEAIIVPVGNECSPRLLKAFAGTGYSYNWTYPPSGTSTAPYIYLYNAGTVTLVVSNVHGCSDSVGQTFSINPSPTASVSYSPAPFCPGNTVTLTASPSGGTAPYSHIWNNGNTTTSFPTSTPGLYTYTVTDQNGCTATASLNLQPNLPPGLDKLPYGCYDICNDATFCAGVTMPYGWTGQWYNGATPFGSVIPAGDDVSVTFSSAGTYTLVYTPDDPSVNCAATSKPIVINVITLPTITITSSVNPVIICKGSGQTIVLTANPQDPSYSYNWYEGGVLVGTGYTYTASTAGTYTVEVSISECCKTSASIVVKEGDCCFENAGVPFTQILSNITVSSNEFWFDKYYIDAVVTVVGNAELDLTNVDCVFGPNGTIEMQDESFLRCNNSVLRPCEKEDIWQGISFFDQSSGWLNTTTVKNAINAVTIDGNSQGVRLTDNSFIKCHTSVNIRNSSSQQSISGNTFETDEVILDYPGDPNEYWAIKMDNTNMNGLISQNEFRHVQPRNTANRYYGIYCNSCNFTASENKFDDMFRAIDVTSNGDVVAIEANQIKLNNLKESYDAYQIRISESDIPVLIYENDMDNGLGDRSGANAIYCENTTRTHIKDNTINGFQLGIHGVGTRDLHVTSNTITSSTNTGIITYATENTYTSCNTIKSMATNASQGSPFLYGIYDFNGNGSSVIYANCIFNMKTATYLQGEGNVPTYINNYMYNYIDNGLYINGYSSGTIGTAGGATNAGRNTFMSNNGAAGSTFDINSVAPGISEGGNFGIMLTNNITSTTSTDRYYSTSDCGHQIQGSYRNNQLDKFNICDKYNLEEWVLKNAKGLYKLKEPEVYLTDNAIDELLKNDKTQVYGMLSASMRKGKEDAEKAADAILNSEMDKNTAARLIVNNCIAIHQPELAAHLLLSTQLKDVNADLREVLATRINYFTTKTFTAAQAQAMKTIDNKNVDFYSAMARDLVQLNNGEHDYKFKKVPAPEFKEATNPLLRLNNSLNVYPVPATQSVTAEYSVADATVKGIKVISVLGAEVANFSYTVQAGSVDIDISNLASGVYTIVLVTDNDQTPMMKGRFIKQ